MSDENAIISSTCENPPSSVLVVVSDDQIRSEAAQAAARMADAYAKGTRRVYGVSWRFFEEWCAKRALEPAAATPELVATYLEARLGVVSPRACKREYGAIAAHLRELQPDGGPWLLGSPPEVVQRWLRGAHKQARPPVKKKPLLPEHFAKLADRPLAGTLTAARDRAILLFGFAGGFRRSEIVGLDVADLELGRDGAIVHIQRSKTDQDSMGAHIAIWRQHDRRCPIAALEDYLQWAQIEEGPIFRSIRNDKPLSSRRLNENAVALIVKAAVRSLGLNPRDYAGHSLRCGFVTAAAMRGATLDEIMNTTRHRTADQVIAYIRRATPFERNASKGLLEDVPHLDLRGPDLTLACGRGHVDKNHEHIGSYCLQGECGEERGQKTPVRRLELRRL